MTQVVSSISGLQVYAPSAGYAPTNSADVSAIASGYQVVSATATQLYAGTAYLTSVNETPVSASRAGNAANASLANSAYYDGTGRLISALPDSAEVSAIASSYAESAASGKQDTLTFAYDDDKISSINGSALAGQGGATGDYVEKSATEVAIGSANIAWDHSLAQGISNTASANSFAQGLNSRASSNSFAQGKNNLARNYSFAQGYSSEATANSFAQGDTTRASSYSFAQGRQITAKNTAAVFGQFNLRGDGHTGTGNSAAFAIGDGVAFNARHDLMLVTKDGEITMYSSTADTVGTGIMSSIRAISAAATGGGGVDSATVSAIASSYAESAVSSKLDESATADFYSTSNPSSFVDSAYVDSAISGKLDSSAIGTAEWMMVPMVTSISGTQISAITAAHADGADSAHTDADGRYLTALAAESSLSSKLDASASSSFYTTANESGFITGVDLSPYQTTAGMTAYQPAGDYQPSGDYYSASNPSGFVDSAYVGSAVSGKQDALTFAYDADSAISSINGSALAEGGDYVENSSLDSASARSATGSVLPTATGISSISGKPLIPTLLAQPTMQYGGQSKFAYMPDTALWTTADEATGVFTPLRYATGACLAMDAGYFKAYYKGNEWFVADNRHGMVRGEVHQSRGLRIVASSTSSASGFELHPSGVVGVSGVKAWALKPEGVSGIGGGGTAWQYGTAEYTQLTSVYDTVSANSASWAASGIQESALGWLEV